MGWTYTKALRGEPITPPKKPAKKKTPASVPKPRPTTPKAKLLAPNRTASASIPNAPLKHDIARSTPQAETNPISQPVSNPIPNPIAEPAPNPAMLAFMARNNLKRIPSFDELKSRPTPPPPTEAVTAETSPVAQQPSPSASGSIEKAKKPTIKKQAPTAKAPSLSSTNSSVEKKIPTKKPTTKPGPKTTSALSLPDKLIKRALKRNRMISEQESNKRRAKTPRTPKSLPVLDHTFSLKYIIKGHTDINPPVRAHDESESSEDLWCCEFEPRTEGRGSDVVAICGSYTILLLDTQQGRYIKKYTHSENQEIFYCMAWTTLQGDQLLNTNVSEEDESCNVLAVAGRLGSIKLLNPLQGECFRYLFGHRKAVLALTFAKAEPRWLFSVSADHTVRLWDIGSPISKIDDSVCLAMFNLPSKSGAPSTVSVSFDLSMVMVGCDNGNMIRFKLTERRLQSFREKCKTFRQNQSETGDKWKMGSVATIAPTMVYPEGDEWHEGYIDDICILGQDGDTESPLYNKIVSRGSEDMEIILWDPVKSSVKDAEIDISLDWPDSGDCTGLRFKVVEQHCQKVLIAGEYEGQIYIYDIGNSKKSKTLEDNSKEQFEPSKILAHTMSSELIRDVTCSSDTSTIVAVDNNNTVFVWTCSV